MPHNYRLKEGWMKRGAMVQLSNNTGRLHNMTVSRIGNAEYVLGMAVQPTGLDKIFPFNPWNIDPVTEKKLPFPEVMG